MRTAIEIFNSYYDTESLRAEDFRGILDGLQKSIDKRESLNQEIHRMITLGEEVPYELSVAYCESYDLYKSIRIQLEFAIAGAVARRDRPWVLLT